MTVTPKTAWRRRRLLQGLAGAAAALALPARAQAFPAKPITFVLPFPAGGSFDPVMRSLAEAASRELGQPVVLTHKPGAGGVPATFTAERLKRFPRVPAVRESGHDFVIESLVGLVAPKGLDPAIAARLTAAFLKATDDPEHKRQLEQFDFIGRPLGADAYRQYAVAQLAREKAMLDEAGFKPA